MSHLLAGHHIFITGAARGIWAAIADTCLGQDAKVSDIDVIPFEPGAGDQMFTAGEAVCDRGETAAANEAAVARRARFA